MARHAGPPSGAPDAPDNDAVAGTVRLEARVSGMVQGVGFRFRTMGKAEELGLDGEVRNLSDGSVERVEDSFSAAQGNFRGFRAH